MSFLFLFCVNISESPRHTEKYCGYVTPDQSKHRHMLKNAVKMNNMKFFICYRGGISFHSLLVTRCKITRFSLQNSLVTRCRRCSLQKITRYSLQRLLVAKHHLLLVAKFARYSLQLCSFLFTRLLSNKYWFQAWMLLRHLITRLASKPVFRYTVGAGVGWVCN